MRSHKKQIHVIKNQDNTWSTKRPHTKRTISRSSTQFEAIGKAITQARREGNTEVIIHGKESEIKNPKTHFRKREPNKIVG